MMAGDGASFLAMSKPRGACNDTLIDSSQVGRAPC